MPGWKQTAYFLICALLGALLGVGLVVLNGTCDQTLICRINPDPTGPYCLPDDGCSSVLRDSALVVTVMSGFGVIVGFTLSRLRRRGAAQDKASSEQ